MEAGEIYEDPIHEWMSWVLKGYEGCGHSTQTSMLHFCFLAHVCLVSARSDGPDQAVHAWGTPLRPALWWPSVSREEAGNNMQRREGNRVYSLENAVAAEGECPHSARTASGI